MVDSIEHFVKSKEGGELTRVILCSACNCFADFRTMIRIRKKWYCLMCKRRLENYGLWPPTDKI